MGPSERYKIACMYALCLAMAIPIGCFVQSNGRWNYLHPLNIVLFASLSAGYAFFIVKLPDAFDRNKMAVACGGSKAYLLCKMASSHGCFQGTTSASKIL